MQGVVIGPAARIYSRGPSAGKLGNLPLADLTGRFIAETLGVPMPGISS